MELECDMNTFFVIFQICEKMRQCLLDRAPKEEKIDQRNYTEKHLC